MRSPHALTRAFAGFALVLAVAACGPSADGPLLTDAREILGRTIAATAPLRTVRVRFDATFQQAPQPGVFGNRGPSGGWLEAQVDLARQELSARGAASDGSGSFEAIVADGAYFIKNTSTGRWAKTVVPAGMMGNPAALFLGGAGIGAGPNVPAILAVAASDPAVGVQLKGVEDCRTGRCYRTTVTIPPATVWQLFTKVTGMDRVGQAAQQPSDGVPAIGLELLTDTKTLRLIDAVASGSANGSSASVRMQLANHDESLVIQPPNPALVDDQGGFGLGFGSDGAEQCVNSDGSTCQILEEVGASIRPDLAP